MKLFLAISGICAVLAMFVGGSSQDTFLFAKPLDNSILISKTGSGKGTIRIEPDEKICGVQCNGPMALSIEEGSVIKLIADPAYDAEFSGWSGACHGRVRVCTVIVGSHTQIVAKFRSR